MKWPKLKCVYLLAVVALFFTCSTVLAGTVPNTLNYQGTLYDATGQPVTGSKDITVSLYDLASGGTAFWTEVQTGIIVKNGNFSLVLGNASGNLLDQTVQAKLSGNTYIGIKVGTDAEMVPRQQFTSVAYALKSGDGVPIGVIVMWSGAINQIPLGWALCDGTNGTPNLKDRFVIGAGNLYSPNNTGGSSTINLSHSHTVNSHSHAGVDHLHNIQHEHYVSRVNDATHNGTGRGLSAGSDYSGWTGWFPISNSYSGAADRNLTSGETAPGTNYQLSAAQANLPPYYALAFIMKVQ